MFTEFKETMIKEIKKGTITMLHQVENIIKRLAFFLKNQM